MNKLKIKKDDDTKGIILIILSILILSLFVGFYFYTKQPQPDPVTGCIGKPTGSVSIILDLSENIATQTAEAISERVKMVIFEVAKPNELISIYYINDNSPTASNDKLNRCLPKSTQDASAADPIRKIKKEFDFFLKKLEEAQTNPNLVGSSKQSPIIQTIMDVYKKNLYQPNKKLIIFSDLWEYTGYINMYSCNSYKEIEEKFEDRWKVKPNFKDYQVYVGRIPREIHPKGYMYPPSARQCRNHFWAKFFTESMPLTPSKDSSKNKIFINVLDELPG